jgi:hypothetical protein
LGNKNFEPFGPTLKILEQQSIIDISVDQIWKLIYLENPGLKKSCLLMNRPRNSGADFWHKTTSSLSMKSQVYRFI